MICVRVKRSVFIRDEAAAATEASGIEAAGMEAPLTEVVGMEAATMPAQRWMGEALLRGAGVAAEKSAELSPVLWQPSDFLSSARVVLGAGAALISAHAKLEP